MKALNYTELDRCLLNNAPLQLPEKLRKRVDSIIEAFSYAKTNPYEDYFAIKRGEKRELINLGEKSDFWYRYLK